MTGNLNVIAQCLIAPLIILQGLYVRSVTPRLPEPEGERSGITGSGSPLSLLILGDSAAAGVGVSAQSQALSGQLAALLRGDFRVSWRLIAETGRTAQEIARQLTAETPEKFDIVVTSVGVNDVTHGTDNKKWIKQQSRIIELLLAKYQARHILLSSIPPMHLFPALPQPLRWYLGLRAKRLNDELKKLVAGSRECEFVEVNFPFEATYMAADGFHPGAIAYRIWANSLAEIIRRRLAVNDF